MRFFILAVLIVLLGVIQGQMWFGPGGVPKVAELQQQLSDQKVANKKAELENARLASEVTDLKTGLGTVEEKARMELGMVRPNEIFVQYTHGTPPPTMSATAKPAGNRATPDAAAKGAKASKPSAKPAATAKKKPEPGKKAVDAMKAHTPKKAEPQRR